MVRAMLVVCVLGCGQGQRPAGPVGPAPGALACELRLRDTGSRVGLSFALVNRAPNAATVHYFHPFLQFDLKATTAGRALSVVQPDVDRPAQLRELAIAAGGSAELATPVSLRFASDAPANDASMVWTIDSPPTSIDLTATLRFEGESLPPCGARLAR
jgi:hypothetical protein